MTETADHNSAAMANALHQRRLQNSISIDEEARERLDVTPEELAEIGADVYGSPARSLGAHRLPEDEDMNEKALLDEGLRALDAELEWIPAADKASFLEAKRINPALVDDEHRRLFLRVEDMDSKRAAKRMTKYWEKRQEIFGPEKCFCPITLDGALRDDQAAWSQEFCQLLPSKDKFGRAILFFDPSRLDGSKYSPESLLRVLWYIHHVAINDPEVQRCGMVVITCEKHAAMHSHQFGFDGGLNRRLTEFDHFFPLKLRAFHMCHPNWLVLMMLPVLKFFLGKRVRLRVVLHGGSEENVLRELSQYGLTPDLLPTRLGGDIVLNAEKWVQSRNVIEASAASSQKYPTKESKPVNVATPLIEKLFSSDVRVRSKGKRQGRKSDPRMDKSIQARQANPTLSLLDALIQGGFTFSNHCDSPNDKGVLDEDGVSLYQRKNQLNRRLRAVKVAGSSITG